MEYPAGKEARTKRPGQFRADCASRTNELSFDVRRTLKPERLCQPNKNPLLTDPSTFSIVN
jgi:hypothetical protein